MDPITAIFTGQDIVQTGKKTKDSFSAQMKAGTNKYDTVLKNRIVKAPKSFGEINAVNANPIFRTAGEEIDFLYKVAAPIDEKPEFQKKQQRPYRANDKSQHMRNENRRPMEKSRLREIRNDKDNRDPVINPYAVLGASVLSAAALQALMAKDVRAPITTAQSEIKKFMHKIPRKTLGKNKSMKNVMDVVQTSTKPLRNPGRRDDFMSRRASEIINEAFEKEAAIATPGKLKDFFLKHPKADKARKVVRDDFLRSGIEAVPYYAAPAALGYVTGQNLSHPEDDPGVTRVIVDVPTDSLQKKMNKQAAPDFGATDIPIPNIDLGWKQWATEQLPRKAVQGLGRSVFPALVIGVTGRNIKGRLEKLEKTDEHKVKDGDTRIIIETKKPIQKTASEELEKSIKKTLDAIDIEKSPLMSGKKGRAVNYNRLRQGVLKQQRMIQPKE